MKGPSTRGWLLLAGALWLGGIGTGVVALARYSMTPGVAPVTAATWPEGARLTRGSGRPVLVMLAHPKCTCTRASLAELAEVMAHVGDSPGREALERVLREDGEGGGTPVYGCALEERQEL
ncbi:hypothetical protein D7V80_34430 [Corallococcus sp. CA054B]|uniref:hypothetical protein n=1 Tax=Corallococcus sp. CA054B TaxID=2316734 RepID=UPI000EA3205C|nr:hypothetical protein [Corallococcus sp. CA054B]RKG61463.1 hypothetical protein D7V80_34430 [Corallococcus sp. CA054B]